MPTPTWDLIAETLTTTVVNDVTFTGLTSISSDYKDLVMVCLIRAQQYDAAFAMQFNGDTGNNYNFGALYAGGETGQTDYGEIRTYPHFSDGGSNDNWGVRTVEFHDFSNPSKYKSVLAKGGSSGGFSGGAADVGQTVGQWENNSPISSIKFYGAQGLQLAAGVQFRLYGVAG